MQIHFRCMQKRGFLVNSGTKVPAVELSLLKYGSANDTKGEGRGGVNI